jgi:hypothetical protein
MLMTRKTKQPAGHHPIANARQIVATKDVAAAKETKDVHCQSKRRHPCVHHRNSLEESEPPKICDSDYQEIQWAMLFLSEASP